MHERRACLYFSWSRPLETQAPLGDIDNRFPALFESRRMQYPRYERLARLDDVDQGIAGFLDHIQKPNFQAFARLAQGATSHETGIHERVNDRGGVLELSDDLLRGIDTLVIVSFDSLRTRQRPFPREMKAIRHFLAEPSHMLFVCPHHDIGNTEGVPPEQWYFRQEKEHFHHGDRSIPPQQRFGGFARAILADLGVPVENRFGLRPRLGHDGSPWPFRAHRAMDRWNLLKDVDTFNAHPHLPHFQRMGAAREKLDVLVQQHVDPSAPPHPFCQEHGREFDALLQSRPGVFAGTLLVCDATLWSSTAGGLSQLQVFWSNVLYRSHASVPSVSQGGSIA